MSRRLLSLLSIALFCVIPSALAYPTGAPEIACSDQIPQHNAVVSGGDNGYVASFPSLASGAPLTYSSPFALTVRIEAPTAGTQFKGFLASVFSVATPTQRVGQIAINNTGLPTGWDAQWICSTYCERCAITHTSAVSKQYLQFSWIPPEEPGTGAVSIEVTIVQSYSEIFTLSYTVAEVIGTSPPDRMSAPFVWDSQRMDAPDDDQFAVTFGWTKPFNGSRPLRNYLFSLDEGAGAQVRYESGLALQTTLRNLPADTAMTAIIQANNTWVSTASPALAFRTPLVTDAVPAPPTGLAVTTDAVPSINSLSISWTDSAAAAAPSAPQFVGYLLQIKRASDSDASYASAYFGSSASALVTGLSASTAYSLRVFEKSMAGSSSSSVVLQATTFGCGAHGVAVPSTGKCRCEDGFLGQQCEVVSPFTGGSQPCWGGHQFCLDWAVQAGMLYARMQGRIGTGTTTLESTSQGWIALGFGAADGHTNGHMLVFRFAAQDDPRLIQLGSTGFTTPATLLPATIPGASISGVYNATHMDVRFQRRLNTTVSGDFTFPLEVNQWVPVSWATGTSYFAQHSSAQRGRASVDFVGQAAREVSSGHGNDAPGPISFKAVIGAVLVGSLLMLIPNRLQ